MLHFFIKFSGMLPDGIGANPVFPLNRGALNSLTVAECNALFGFYGLPIPAANVNVANRRDSLRAFINAPMLHQ
jgi:hypothetical protein